MNEELNFWTQAPRKLKIKKEDIIIWTNQNSDLLLLECNERV